MEFPERGGVGFPGSVGGGGALTSPLASLEKRGGRAGWGQAFDSASSHLASALARALAQSGCSPPSLRSGDDTASVQMHRPRRPASPRFQPSGSVQVPAVAAAAAGLDGRRLPRPRRADPASPLSGKVGGAARAVGRGIECRAGRVRSVRHRRECVRAALWVPGCPRR